MRIAHIANGFVTNISEGDAAWFNAQPSGSVVQAGPDVGIGDAYDPVAGFTPVATPMPVPQSLTPRQVRLVLNAAGLRATVEAAVAAADQNTQDMWQYSTVFLRTDPILIGMATSIGLTSANLDQLFIDGAAL